MEIDSADDDDINDDDLDDDKDDGHELDGPKSKQAKKVNSPKPNKTAKSGTSKKAVAKPRAKAAPVEDAAILDTLNFIRGVGRNGEGQGMPASVSKARAPVQRKQAKSTGKQQDHVWTTDGDDDDDDDSDDIDQVNGWKVIGGRSRLDVG